MLVDGSRCSVEVMEAREERRPVKYFKPPLTKVELEELQASVETLTNENNLLRDELKRISGECEKLASENVSLKGELSNHNGPEKLPGDDDYHLSLANEGFAFDERSTDYRLECPKSSTPLLCKRQLDLIDRPTGMHTKAEGGGVGRKLNRWLH
ncbi:hypothetical protein L1987_17402 [Smallanthus sonchifolius]|uniref:Uncharacterized protein n=1 Tax=Smallanthus sonchifolius TaxID=185202 RepID=A0ACB9IZC1_9ASTR|nr:hypothetical protein L1987_17402 [Smallanthus sonchifolius]